MPIACWRRAAAKPSSGPSALTTPPKLDGVLDDEAWSGDPLPLDTWMSYNPMRGEAAAEKTQVWMAYDDEAHLLRVPLPRHAARKNPHDHQPPRQRVRRRLGRRQPRLEPRRPAGLSPVRQPERHPDGRAAERQRAAKTSRPTGCGRAPGHVGADGWSAEIRVPLENIRFRSGTDVRMGVLFWRRLSRTGVSSSWPEMAPGKWVFESNAVDRRSTSCSRGACSR